MPLFPELERTQGTQEDIASAQALRALAVELYSHRQGWNKKRWALEFSRMRKRHKLEDGELLKAVEWYCARAQAKEKVPKVVTAKQFCKESVWQWIQELRSKDHSETEILPEVQKIVTRLKEQLGWPDQETLEQLPITCQITYNNYKDFLGKLRVFHRRMEKTMIKNKQARGVLNSKDYMRTRILDNFIGHFGHPTVFTTNWLRMINEKLQHWPEWSGNLTQFAFSIDSKWLRGAKDLTRGMPWPDFIKEVYQ